MFFNRPFGEFQRIVTAWVYVGTLRVHVMLVQVWLNDNVLFHCACFFI
jgi:hypothetical protein